MTLEAELPGGTAGDVGVKLRKGAGKETVIGYDAARQEVYIDRTRSGQTGFKKEFSGRFTAPLKREDSPNGRIKLQIFVDRSSVVLIIEIIAINVIIVNDTAFILQDFQPAVFDAHP